MHDSVLCAPTSGKFVFACENVDGRQTLVEWQIVQSSEN